MSEQDAANTSEVFHFACEGAFKEVIRPFLTLADSSSCAEKGLRIGVVYARRNGKKLQEQAFDLINDKEACSGLLVVWEPEGKEEQEK